MKHVNIPIFIPHLGCPNNCVFCNQRSISGKIEFHPESVENEIESALSTIDGDCETEIAFFGGSFTGIDRGLMISLLETAKKYIDSAKVSSVRLSTRPDYIDGEILDILAQYGVKTIELGLQSMDDNVLLATKRGHTAQDGIRACEAVKKHGFSLVGQMMVGLPAADPESEKYTAELLCRFGVDAVRIYPTVVFYDTELCEMAQRGEYTPIGNDEAVKRTKELLKIFDKHGVECIRVGLCASENLSSADRVFGGANHSAIGELAMGEVFYDRICEEIEKLGEVKGRALTVTVPRGATSKAVGQKKRNTQRLYEKYSPRSIKVVEKNSILGYNVIIEIN